MLAEIVDHLRCPHCAADLRLAAGALRCPAGHAFDIARQGYASLLPGDAQTATGDTADMVACRERFLAGGHYEPIVRAVADAAERALAGGPDGCVVDLGAGTGHHLAAVLDRAPGRVGLALDLSKYALRRAARAHERAGAVACDAWRPLPVRSRTAALVLSVFAPRGGAEIARILRPGGTLLVVTPTADHLGPLVAALGLLAVDARKEERTARAVAPHLVEDSRAPCAFTMILDHGDVVRLAGMGPSARHVDRAELRDRVARLPEPVAVPVSVTITAYRRP